MSAVLMILALASSPPDPTDMGWVVSLGVFDTEEGARELAVDLDELSFEPVDYLWIPDWESLSGYKGWLVYSGPFDDTALASSEACNWLYRYRDVFLIWVGQGEVRETMPPVPQRLWDIRGIMPPACEFAAGYEVERNFIHVEGDQPCDCMIPEMVTITLPGWRMELCLDSFIGGIERRAYRTGDYDAIEQYEFASAYMKEHADALGLVLFEDPGRYTLVHLLPDPELRESDADIWVALRNDTLEYGSRIRLFYGYHRETWHHTPDEVHESFIPDVVQSREKAIEYLMTALTWSGAYGGPFPEGYSFGIESLDDLDEGEYRDYFDIAIREVHHPGGPGDPAVSPIVDRFRVYNRGEVIWFRMPEGMFVPFEECLE